VSPKSRGRKTAKRGQQRPPRGSGGRPESARSDLARVVVSQLDVLADTAAVSTPYEAEVATSVVIGNLIETPTVAGLPIETATALLSDTLYDVVDTLARRTPRHAYLALRSLAVVAPPDVAGYAGEAAGKIQDGDAPSWIAGLGQVTAGRCFAVQGEFGEDTALICEFSYPGGAQPHCVFAVIDAAWHGAVTTLTAGDESPDKVRRTLEKDAKHKGRPLREVSHAQAGALLRDGIASFYRHGQAPDMPGAERYGMLCSSLGIARARSEVLVPGPPEAAPMAQRWPVEARKRLVEEFLASPQASDLRDPVSRKIPHMLAACSVNHLGCDPTVIGPAVLERILLNVLPAITLAPDRFGRAVPQAVRAWTEWLADSSELPVRSRRRLMASTRTTLMKFGAAWYGPTASPLRRYVDDLSDEDASTGHVVNEVIERRIFAVPPPDERRDGLAETDGGRGRAADELDAADEGDRALVTLLELSARGLSQHRFPPYLAVVRELWDNDPPEVWAAAQRMRAAGRSREAVLDRLARTWDVSGSDPDAYAAELGRLR
jgi:hypothetical protein